MEREGVIGMQVIMHDAERVHKAGVLTRVRPGEAGHRRPRIVTTVRGSPR